MLFRVKTAESWTTVTNGALLRFIIHDMGMTHRINTYVIYCIFISPVSNCALLLQKLMKIEVCGPYD